VPSFDSSLEQPMSAPAPRRGVTTVGYTRGEGLAVLSPNA
jgi:3-oxoacyl-[acyl-carrier-protein] synthase II